MGILSSYRLPSFNDEPSSRSSAMETPIAATFDERSHLLEDAEGQHRQHHYSARQDRQHHSEPGGDGASVGSEESCSPQNAHILAILPLPFSAALGIALTIATTLFAYATILCKDPTRCRDAERNAYAGSVAGATLIANACGLLVLGYLEKVSRRTYKTGLVLWFSCRGMSVVMLALGGWLDPPVLPLFPYVLDHDEATKLLMNFWKSTCKASW